MAKSKKQPDPTPLYADLDKTKSGEPSALTPMPNTERMFFEEPVLASIEERKLPSKTKSKQNTSANKEPSSFYLQLHIDNLAKYLSNGLIYPVSWEVESTYKTNRESRIDVLTSFPNHLCLAPGFIVAFREREVLLEIVLTQEEISNLQPIQSVFLHNGALPISRIKQVFFPSNHAKDRYLASREVFEDFFFPNTLASTTLDNLLKLDSLEEEVSILVSKVAPYIEQFALFDRVLGLFAFLRNIPLLRAEKTSTITDWDNTVLVALSLINGAIKLSGKPTGASLFKSMLLIDSNGPVAPTTERQLLLNTIITRIYSGESFEYEWAANTVAEYSELKPFSAIFLSLSQEGRSNFQTAISLFRASATRPENNLPLIILVLLCKFSNKSRSHTDKQAIRIYFHQEISASEYEISICAAVMGLYYGYQNMVRDDKNYTLSDKVFANIANATNRIKFKTDLFLDRFVIESVFQFIWNNKRSLSDEFSYLNYPRERPSFSPSLPLGYSSTPIVLLGKSILNATASIWNAYVRELPQSVPLSHPILQVLSIFNPSIPRDVIARTLHELTPEQQEKVILLLSALKK